VNGYHFLNLFTSACWAAVKGTAGGGFATFCAISCAMVFCIGAAGAAAVKVGVITDCG
jgi:hypothetical protein